MKTQIIKIENFEEARVGWNRIFEKLTKKDKKDKALKDFENIEHDWDENEWEW
jgi:hypothetical protein